MSHELLAVLDRLLGNSSRLERAWVSLQPYFARTDDWSSPLHLESPRGPVDPASLIGGIAALIKNPNLCSAVSGQGILDLEEATIRTLAALVYDDPSRAGGLFTTGGTLSNLYGARLGLAKIAPEAMTHGWGTLRHAPIVSEAAHRCQRTIAGWIGLGTNHVVTITTDADHAIRIDRFAETLDELHRSGQVVPYVVATWGTTDAGGIDDVAEMKRILTEWADRHGIPVPWLHVDAALGWPLIWLRDLSPELLHQHEKLGLSAVQTQIHGLAHADSIVLDPHKFGGVPYPASVILVRDRQDLYRLARPDDPIDYWPTDPVRDPGQFTLETSRPAGPVLATAAVLAADSPQAWQGRVLHSLTLSHDLADRLGERRHCFVWNRGVTSLSRLWWVLPPGEDASRWAVLLHDGRLVDEDRQRLLAWVRDRYDRYHQTRDLASDPILGWSDRIGTRPGGFHIPAWRAHFFHPAAPASLIDRLLERIDSLT